ncbi:uncharacterized protein LOC108907304 [Anoplophora glabripennis]|uniref:uncharacterized protein LOC108907304 n=1 Tax=Anoplophora glabripennis TaxID=217634 RepID=UPI0008743A9F|nr:uncharacterized protein LOC108907304 [Anoplophora glabripennis]XP_018566444.1 uncharacterized protein LOC108907304 [Anoplophora glabripennis]XP_018566445.1 uncharacterized protein LOC108907304 [Anoplophora glabripennis]XP_018566446.1 uncharacterized protein LOC108907304 [Anoplophora glabripennis]XP_018566447.1 uncharacterized protein LOC108907304 [Anoplophora glabripennis]XP_018566448.1 uncharacterized protein LOC108907304 [Anoplophora glabripennis]
MESVIVPNENRSLATEKGNNDSECNKSEINLNGQIEKEVSETKVFTTVTQIQVTEVTVNPKDLDTDIVILRKDPTTRRNLINKSAYAKLHRTLSPDRNNTIDSLKEKYESKPDLIDVKSNPKEASATEENKSPRTPTKLDEETVQSLKDKYSPARFGYPKIAPKPSKLPLAKPRSAVKSQIILPSTKPSDKEKARYSLNVDKKSKSKDENSNELHRKNSSSSGEFVTIITRSESEGSVDKMEKELNLFTMDTKPKDKKRANSFRKIFSGKIFGKDKKKKGDEKDKNKLQSKQNVADVQNIQNETNSFNRQTNYRHTVGGNSSIKPKETRPTIRSESDAYSNQQNRYITKEMEDRYAQMHVNQFNHIKNAFEHTNSVPAVQPAEGYVRMDKPLVKNNPGPTNYMNLPNVRKYIDTSSSASTLESERSNSQNEVAQINREIERRNELEARNDNFNSLKSVRFEGSKDNTRDTPPRAQELRQDVRLVNPKALIPITSERPLPNPYQNSNSSTLDKPRPSPQLNPVENLDRTNQTRPHLEETYGIVFDSLVRNKSPQQPSAKINELKNDQKPPRSPSVEPSKLKLPPNREIIPLSPRVKSPIPHDNISAEKIIATELLKPLKSPTLTRKSNTRLASPSHQKLEIDIDYPDNISNERHENRTIEKSKPPLLTKPPISKIPFRRSPEASSSSANSLTRQSTSQNSLAFDIKRLSQSSPTSENLENTYARYRRSQASPLASPLAENQERIITNAMVHVNSNVRSPTPVNLMNSRPLSPVTPSIRSSTPVDFRSSPTAKTSPQKEEMRRSVEAFYWKELKKLKDQENYEMYLYQMQMMPYGYAEDPITVRRSRSLSPTTHRNSRRSLSLPRDTRQTNVKDVPEMYGRIQPAPIPEGRAVVHQQVPQRNVIYGQLQYQPNFRRNAPERRTIDSTPRSYENYNNTYRPIFKRGSLSTPVKEQDEVQNKKVSFSGSNPQNVQVWPTRNGFTQSPPQRRVDNNNRLSTVEDDVFLPTTPRTPIRYDGNDIYGYINKPIRYEYAPNPNEVVYYTRQNMEVQNSEPTYDRNPNVRYTVNYPQDENPYGQHVDAKPPYRMTRHGSIQLQEPLYDQRQMVSRRRSFENGQVRPVQESQYINRQPNSQVNATIGIRREIILNDEIFGQFGGYVQPNDERYLQNRQNAIYSSKQSVAEPLYGRTGQKQVTVSNKVCDIYGQIHDTDSSALSTPTQVRRTGVIMGQLQSNPGSPQVTRQTQSGLTNEQFARNTRLTASANDMYRRYQNVDPRYRSDVVYDGVRYQQQQKQQEIAAPTRPLPPVPTKKGLMRNSSGKSDTDSDVSEIQRLNSGAKNKKRSFFGK